MFAMCGSSVQILPVRLQTMCLWPNTQGFEPNELLAAMDVVWL